MTDIALSPIIRCLVIASQRHALLSRFSLSPVSHLGPDAIQRQSIFAGFLVHNPQKDRVGGPMGPVVVPWVVHLIAILFNGLICFLTWDHRDHPKCSRRGDVSGERKATTPWGIVALRLPLQIFGRNLLYMSGPVVPSYLYPATTRLSDGTTMGPPWDHHSFWWSHCSVHANDSQSYKTRELQGGYLNAT